MFAASRRVGSLLLALQDKKHVTLIVRLPSCSASVQQPILHMFVRSYMTTLAHL